MHIVIMILLLSFFTGCGPSGSEGGISTNLNNPQGSQDSISSVISQNNTLSSDSITLQRGPVMFSKVEDANGQEAMNFGSTNNYIFATAPSLPITAKGGYIDINRNGFIDENDTLLDVTLSSYSNLITPITTVIDNNNTILQEIIKSYGFTQEELLQEIPSHTSPMMIILNNAFYKSLYKGYDYNSTNFLQTIQDLNKSYSENSTLVATQDLQLLASILEKKLLDELNASRVSEQNLQEINITLQAQNLQIVNNYFRRNTKTTDKVETIWNILIPIDIHQNISNFSLGVHIEKVSSGAIGNIIISGASIKNKQLTNAKSVKIFGEKSDNTTGSISYDSEKSISQGAIKLFSNKLLINLGYIIKQQKIISQNSFTSTSTYNITIYSDKLDINATETHNINNLQISYSKYFTFATGSDLLTGKIIIE